MRAVILRKGQLVVEDVAEPVPASGQVLVETIACGICGSDLHCARHAATFTAAARATGLSIFDFDADADLVMGHEFSARVVDLGPGVSGLSPGQAVVAHPVIRTPQGVRAVGYSNDHPGAYAERFVVDARGVIPIPSGTDPVLAALTEPLAVGLHAVNESSAVSFGSAVVIGCGPVGLATVIALARRRVPLIVAADLSPTRRELARRVGAHLVVDPRAEAAVDTWRAAGGKGPTCVFEAVGVPGMIDAAMRAAPSRSEVVVVGLCMEPDRFEPTVAITKHLTVRFVLGWTPAEFAESLADIGERADDVAPLVTGHVDLDATPAAFADLADPAGHAKILVRPHG